MKYYFMGNGLTAVNGLRAMCCRPDITADILNIKLCRKLLYLLLFLFSPKPSDKYTGLTDRNGRKIFEGDICKFKRFYDVHIGKVVFNVTTASFIMWYQPIVGAYGEKATQKMLLSVCDDIEVIGNIHDNPELLE